MNCGQHFGEISTPSWLVRKKAEENARYHFMIIIIFNK